MCPPFQSVGADGEQLRGQRRGRSKIDPVFPPYLILADFICGGNKKVLSPWIPEKWVGSPKSAVGSCIVSWRQTMKRVKREKKEKREGERTIFFKFYRPPFLIRAASRAACHCSFVLFLISKRAHFWKRCQRMWSTSPGSSSALAYILLKHVLEVHLFKQLSFSSGWRSLQTFWRHSLRVALNSRSCLRCCFLLCGDAWHAVMRSRKQHSRVHLIMHRYDPGDAFSYFERLVGGTPHSQTTAPNLKISTAQRGQPISSYQVYSRVVLASLGS